MENNEDKIKDKIKEIEDRLQKALVNECVYDTRYYSTILKEDVPFLLWCFRNEQKKVNQIKQMLGA